MENKKKRKKPSSYRQKSNSKVRLVSISLILFLLLGLIGSGVYLSFGQQTSNTNPSIPQGTTEPLSGNPVGTSYPSQGHQHLTDEAIAAFHYNTDPPLSGPHQEVFPETFLFDQQVSSNIFIHMLEHGNINIAYNGISQDQKQKLTQWVNEHNKPFVGQPLAQAAETGKIVFLTPWNTLPIGTIVLCAWTRNWVLSEWDSTKADQFSAAWQGNSQNASQ